MRKTHTINRFTDLSESIRRARDRAVSTSVEAAQQSLVAERLLIEAKDYCQHGEWFPFLKMAGVAEPRTQRLMRLPFDAPK